MNSCNKGFPYTRFEEQLIKLKDTPVNEQAYKRGIATGKQVMLIFINAV